MIAGLLDHLWQSSLVAGGIGLLTLLFRRNGAAVRFWLWFAASLKFLVPFAGLAALGAILSRQFPTALPPSLLAIQPAAEKLSAPAGLLIAPHAHSFEPGSWLLGIWLCGFAVILGVRLLRWLRLRAVTTNAQEVAAAGILPAPIKTSSSLLEPGLVGIVAPVVLLPAGLMAHLSGPERESILAHEFSHLSRRDNVTAAIHMMVEALFWFYPPVWLIGGRLIAERERACDESVLASGHDPQVYAGGILKVCKFCIQSPLACASGASGADLKQRVRWIMREDAAMDVHFFQLLLLATAVTVTLALPVMTGFRNTPLAATVKKVMAVQAHAEQAVAAVAEQIGFAPVRHVAIRKRLKGAVAMAGPVLPQIEATVPQVLAPQTPVSRPMSATAPAIAPVLAAVSTPASQPATAREAVLALNPDGAGDPDAVTCRLPQLLPGSRLAGPKVCQPNRVWAELRARRQDISPDGKTVVMLDGSQRYMDVHGCSGVQAVASSTSTFSGRALNFCF
jgi:beta-lactamase regulating signal transducer with metallopeptidase domain